MAYLLGRPHGSVSNMFGVLGDIHGFDGGPLGVVRDILAGVFGYIGSFDGGFLGVLRQVLRPSGLRGASSLP
jgi:hypothetical protein